MAKGNSRYYYRFDPSHPIKLGGTKLPVVIKIVSTMQTFPSFFFFKYRFIHSHARRYNYSFLPFLSKATKRTLEKRNRSPLRSVKSDPRSRFNSYLVKFNPIIKAACYLETYHFECTFNANPNLSASFLYRLFFVQLSNAIPWFLIIRR